MVHSVPRVSMVTFYSGRYRGIINSHRHDQGESKGVPVFHLLDSRHIENINNNY